MNKRRPDIYRVQETGYIVENKEVKAKPKKMKEFIFIFRIVNVSKIKYEKLN